MIVYQDKISDSANMAQTEWPQVAAEEVTNISPVPEDIQLVINLNKIIRSK